MEIPRELVMMADYAASPVWSRTPSGHAGVSIPLDQLPLSSKIKSDLTEWARQHDKHIDDDEEFSKDEEAEWIERGRQLAIRAADELAPHFSLTYIEGMFH